MFMWPVALLVCTVLGMGEGRVVVASGNGLCLNCRPLGDRGVGASLHISEVSNIPLWSSLMMIPGEWMAYLASSSETVLGSAFNEMFPNGL